MRKGLRPTFIAIGHNFGCEESRNTIGGVGRGREDNIVGTWRSLDRLLDQAHADPDLCFRTNWFVGLRAGDENDGTFLVEANEPYEEACSRLLLKQINYLRPHAIMLLGPKVAKRSYRIAPELSRWRFPRKKEITFTDIDAKGHTFKETPIRDSEHSVNIVALLHPSKGWMNEPKRKERIGLTESELIRGALS